jgi:hypothetical protein
LIFLFSHCSPCLHPYYLLNKTISYPIFNIKLTTLIIIDHHWSVFCIDNQTVLNWQQHVTIVLFSIVIFYLELSTFDFLKQNHIVLLSKIDKILQVNLFFFLIKCFKHFEIILIIAIFGFRSVGAYSRVQIQNYVSGLWLCMNKAGRIVPKVFYYFLNFIIFKIHLFCFYSRISHWIILLVHFVKIQMVPI